jgi:hypothetical protein
MAVRRERFVSVRVEVIVGLSADVSRRCCQHGAGIVCIFAYM